mgnify:CR=1 FL=1
MGILKRLFKSDDDSNLEFEWNYLLKISDFDRIIESSYDRTVVIFKHSTRCGISSSVLRKFEKAMVDKQAGYSFNMIKVIENRELSDEIAQRFSIRHESPQLLTIKNKAVQKYGSHYDILTLEF